MDFVAPELSEGACHGFVGSASCHTGGGSGICRWRRCAVDGTALLATVSGYSTGSAIPSNWMVAPYCPTVLPWKLFSLIVSMVSICLQIPVSTCYWTHIIPVFWGLTGNCSWGLNLSELWVWHCSVPSGKDRSPARASARSRISLLPVLGYDSAK